MEIIEKPTEFSNEFNKYSISSFRWEDYLFHLKLINIVKMHSECLLELQYNGGDIHDTIYLAFPIKNINLLEVNHCYLLSRDAFSIKEIIYNSTLRKRINFKVSADVTQG